MLSFTGDSLNIHRFPVLVYGHKFQKIISGELLQQWNFFIELCRLLSTITVQKLCLMGYVFLMKI